MPGVAVLGLQGRPGVRVRAAGHAERRPVMAKRGKDDIQKHIEKTTKRDEKAAGSSRHQAFCPRCGVWYPTNSNAHAGH